MPGRKETIIRTGCKLNLSLEITGIRPDRYHTIESVMYPLSEPHDILRCTRTATLGQFVLHCPNRPDLEGSGNILHKIWNLVSAHVGSLPGICVELEKQVPEGAGLGGGSANAAGFLKYLLALPEIPTVSEAKCLEIAAQAGADVPFFLKNVPAFASGIGEQLCFSDISLADLYLLLVFPDIHVSTAWAYAAWDCTAIRDNKVGSSKKIPHLCHVMPAQDLTSAPPADTTRRVHEFSFYNSFEDVVFSKYPDLRRIKETLWKTGAIAALMSGSGSCIFGLFDEEQTGKNAAEMICRQGIKTLLQKL